MSQATAPNTATIEDVQAGPVPRHVAVIMDGNGRWAGERDLPRWEGHRAGMSSVREIIEGAAEAGLEHLTLYAFSEENWSRPADEVEALMALLEEYVATERAELAEKGIRVTVFGSLERLGEGASRAIAELEGATAEGTSLHVHLAISYGARGEIVAACQSLARRVAAGELDPEEITADQFAHALYTSAWPDPDLLIRTSGEMRISNFLLWQLAYSEIFVTDVLWPDFSRAHLFGALIDYRGRDRRFGLVRSP